MKYLCILAALLACASNAFAQEQPEPESQDGERVKYTLILPEEKTPELVKNEEPNPFESGTNGTVTDKGDTEENRVRDILLRLPVGGGVVGERGIRVMLGGMRLETGGEVPPVLPDQQVKLKVKAITPTTVELVWVEKKPGALLPKSLVIPIDASPKVRYQLPAFEGGGGMGAMRRDGVSAFALPPASSPSSPDPGKGTVQRAEPVPEFNLIAELSSAPLPPSSKSTADEAESTVRRAEPVPDLNLIAEQSPAALPQPSNPSADAAEPAIQRAEPVPEFNLIAELSSAPLPQPSKPPADAAKAAGKETEPAAEVRVAQASSPSTPPPPPVPPAPEAASSEMKAARPKPDFAEVSSPPTPANAPTASVWRMLFGNHAPQEK